MKYLAIFLLVSCSTVPMNNPDRLKNEFRIVTACTSPNNQTLQVVDEQKNFLGHFVRGNYAYSCGSYNYSCVLWFDGYQYFRKCDPKS